MSSLRLLACRASRSSPTRISGITLSRTVQLSIRTRLSVVPRLCSASANMSSSTVKETTDRDGKTVRVIREGKANVLVPQGAEVKEDKNEVQQVFYNPIQQYNRDLSVLAIKTYGEKALAARQKASQASKARHSRKRKRGDADTDAKPEEAKNAEDGNNEVKEPGAPVADADAPPAEAPKQSFKILDALSASGLRALRYGHEVPFATSITANDLSPTAAESIRQNVKQNGLEDIIQVTEGDALGVMYKAIAEDLCNRDAKGQPSKLNKFDVIDLDPYGTAAPFFDAAVQAIRDDGGLLAVTCTDSALWAGHCYTEKSFALYGGVPLKGLHSHEGGLRMIIHAVSTSAARYGLHVEPQLSLSIDYYTKLFLKVTKSPAAVKFHGSKTMVVFTCDSGCGAWETQHLLKSKLTATKNGNGHFYKHGMHIGPTADRLCQHCGNKMHLGGPMYGGPIHKKEFVEDLLAQIPKADAETYQTLPRLEGMLTNVMEEFFLETEEAKKLPKEASWAEIDEFPFFFMPSKVASALSCQTPPEDQIRGALVHLGYRIGTSHCRAGSIKTNAPWATIWWVFTEWARQVSPIKLEKIKPTMAAWKILNDRGFFDEKPATENREAKRAENEDGDTAMDGAQDAQQQQTPVGEGQGLVVPESEKELRKTLVFNEDLAKLGKKARPQGIVRYQENPRAFWGPLAKASAR